MSLEKKIFAVTIAAVPFMNWPWMLTGASYTRPLSIYPMIVGLALLMFGGMIRGRVNTNIPAPLKMFTLFVAWAFFITVVMGFVSPGVEEMKGITAGKRALRDLMALLLGYLFYLYFSLVIRSTERSAAAVRVLYLVFPLLLFASAVQAGRLYFGSELAAWLDDNLLRPFQAKHGHPKVYGFSPESSMYADQLLTIFLPFSAAALIIRHSFFKTRPLGVSVEFWVFMSSLAVLILTFSRIGLIAFIFTVMVYMFALLIKGRRAGRVPVLIIVVVLTLVAGLLQFDFLSEAFFGTLFSIRGVEDSISMGIFSNITRMANNLTALRMFVHYPFGVGVGGYPFHYEFYLPDFALASPEVQAYLGIVNPYFNLTDILEGMLPNPKGLIPRILVETGFMGFLLFSAFIFFLLRRSCNTLRLSESPANRTLALGCLLSITTMLPLSFSVDSYVWIHYFMVAAIAAGIGNE